MDLRNRNWSIAFCSHFSAFFRFFPHFSHFSHFSHFFTFSKLIFFTFFPGAFSKRIFFTFFHFLRKMWNMWKNVKKCVLKMRLEKKCEKMCFENALEKLRKKCAKKCEKMRKMWKQCLKIQLGRWNSEFFSSGLIFLGSSFAAVTLLPAQLLQVENRRGAVQIDRKWTVQIADLLNLAIAKQWLPGQKHKIKWRRKREQNLKIA